MFGAFLGAGLFGAVYFRFKKVYFFAYADAAVPAIALGCAIARVGCFMNVMTSELLPTSHGVCDFLQVQMLFIPICPEDS